MQLHEQVVLQHPDEHPVQELGLVVVGSGRQELIHGRGQRQQLQVVRQAFTLHERDVSYASGHFIFQKLQCVCVQYRELLGKLVSQQGGGVVGDERRKHVLVAPCQGEDNGGFAPVYQVAGFSPDLPKT